MVDARAFAHAAGAARAALASTGDPYGAAQGSLIDAIGAALVGNAPDLAATWAAAKDGVTTRLTPAAVTITSASIEPGALHDGDKDAIWYWHHAYFVWERDADRPLQMAYLGGDVLRAQRVWQLKADLAELAGKDATHVGGRTALHRRTIESLLGLDPFAATADPLLPPARFAEATAQLQPGADAVCPAVPTTYRLRIDAAYTTREPHARFSTDAANYGKSWRAGLFGADDDAPFSASLDLSRDVAIASSAMPTYEARLGPAAAGDDAGGEPTCVKVYFDALFGTFAFTRVSRAGRPPH